MPSSKRQLSITPSTDVVSSANTRSHDLRASASARERHPKRQKSLSQHGSHHASSNPPVTSNKPSSRPSSQRSNSSRSAARDFVEFLSDFEDESPKKRTAGLAPPVALKSNKVLVKPTRRLIEHSAVASSSTITSTSKNKSSYKRSRPPISDPENEDSLAREFTTPLWSEKYTPITLSDLAVHPKKLELIHGWLKDAHSGPPSIRKYRRLLVLGGPAGCGKSAIIRALAKSPDHTNNSHTEQPRIPTGNRSGKGKAKAEVELNGLGYEILEWEESGGDQISSTWSRMSEFPCWLTRASFGPTLLFEETKDSIAPHQHHTASAKQDGSSRSVQCPQDSQKPKLLLVDELPNLHHGQTLSAFCDALRLHLNSSRPSTPPLVLIISDTTLRPGQEGADNILSSHGNLGGGFNREDRGMNVRSLLPTEILQHPACFHIRLNAVNKTIMKKMLNRVLSEDGCFGTGLSKHKKPSVKDVDDIITASNGDIRVALNNLQFIYNHPPSTRLSRASKFKLTDQETLRQPANKIESLLGARESSLVIFHGLGKVLYNKRWGDDATEDAKDKRFRPPSPERVPKFLKEFERRQLKTDVEALFSETSTGTDQFIAYLHHNYPAFTDDVDEMGVLLEYMSFADSSLYLNAERWIQKPISQLYQFHVTIRGMLIGLPSPVTRKKTQTLAKSAHWEYSRQQFENAKDIESFKHAQAALSTQRIRVQPGHGLERIDGFMSKLDIDDMHSSSSMLYASKTVLATEFLPYIALIDRTHSRLDPIIERLSTYKPLKSVIGQVSNISALSEDEEAEEKSENEEEWEVDLEKRRLTQPNQVSEVDLNGKLWFEEDDDIEDF